MAACREGTLKQYVLINATKYFECCIGTCWIKNVLTLLCQQENRKKERQDKLIVGIYANRLPVWQSTSHSVPDWNKMKSVDWLFWFHIKKKRKKRKRKAIWWWQTLKQRISSNLGHPASSCWLADWLHLSSSPQLLLISQEVIKGGCCSLQPGGWRPQSASAVRGVGAFRGFSFRSFVLFCSECFGSVLLELIWTEAFCFPMKHDTWLGFFTVSCFSHSNVIKQRWRWLQVKDVKAKAESQRNIKSIVIWHSGSS